MHVFSNIPLFHGLSAEPPEVLLRRASAEPQRPAARFSKGLQQYPPPKKILRPDLYLLGGGGDYCNPLFRGRRVERGEVQIWKFPKTRGTFGGFFVIRTIICWA